MKRGTRPVTYHQVHQVDGVRFTHCVYENAGSRVVELGRARTRCPRCGAELRRRGWRA